MDTTLVSYMYMHRIKNIYVLLKGNGTTKYNVSSLILSQGYGRYMAVNMINTIQTKCIKRVSSCYLEPVGFATSDAHAIGAIFT